MKNIKEKILLLIGGLLLIGVLVFFDRLIGKSSVAGRVDIPLKNYTGTPADEPSAGPAADSIQPLTNGRNPFISSTQKVEFWPELPLPGAVFKRPGYILLTPYPDLQYYRLPLPDITVKNKVYQYSLSGSRAIDSSDLPSVDEINRLIDETKLDKSVQPFQPPPEVLEDDIIHFKDNTSRRGRVISEDEGKIYFLPKGTSKFIPYNRNDISHLERHYTAAEQYRQKRNEILPNDAEGHYKLAQWCLSRYLETEAIQEFQAAIKINNSNLNYYTAAGDYYRQRLNLEEEIKLYRQALASPLVNKEVIYLRLGEVYRILGMTSESLDAFKSAVKSLPTYPDGLLKLGDAYCAGRNYEEAAKIYKQAENLKSNPAALNLSLGRLDFKKGDLKPAWEKLDRSLSLGPQNFEALNLIAAASLLLNEPAEAADAWQKAVKVKPEQAAPWINLAVCYLLAEEFSAAELLFKEAAERDPANPFPQIGLGYLRWSQGNRDEALEFFRAVALMEPEHPELLYARGQMALEENQLGEAEKKMRRCLQIDPFRSDIFYHLGVIAYLDKKYEESDWYLTRYLEKSETASAAELTMAAFAKLGVKKNAPAEQLLARALQQNDRYAPALNARAYLAYQRKDSQLSLDILNEATRIDPANDYARQTASLIRKITSQVVWEESFDRSDRNEAGEGWEENESYGIEIFIKDKKLKFQGIQAMQDNGLTRLSRTVAADIFLKIEAGLEVSSGSTAAAGIYLANPESKAGLLIALVNNKLAYNFTKNDSVADQWVWLTKDELNQKPFILVLEKNAISGGMEFQCYLDGKPVGVVPANKTAALRSAKTYSVGVFGYAELKKEWGLTVSNVKIFEKRQGGK